MAHITVLFIDDDRCIRDLAAVMLKRELFQTRLASNTAEALAILKSTPVDVIICDVMMPEENGMEFCRRLRERGSRIPFLFLSALSQAELVAEGLSSGAEAYLLKPFDIKELENRILSLLRRPQ